MICKTPNNNFFLPMTFACIFEKLMHENLFLFTATDKH